MINIAKVEVWYLYKSFLYIDDHYKNLGQQNKTKRKKTI